MTKEVFLHLCDTQLNELNKALKGREYTESQVLSIFNESGMGSVYPILWDDKERVFKLNQSEIESYCEKAKQRDGVDFIVA